VPAGSVTKVTSCTTGAAATSTASAPDVVDGSGRQSAIRRRRCASRTAAFQARLAAPATTSATRSIRPRSTLSPSATRIQVFALMRARSSTALRAATPSTLPSRCCHPSHSCGEWSTARRTTTMG
jgi:hypothetical protein